MRGRANLPSRYCVFQDPRLWGYAFRGKNAIGRGCPTLYRRCGRMAVRQLTAACDGPGSGRLVGHSSPIRLLESPSIREESAKGNCPTLRMAIPKASDCY